MKRSDADTGANTESNATLIGSLVTGAALFACALAIGMVLRAPVPNSNVEASAAVGELADHPLAIDTSNALSTASSNLADTPFSTVTQNETAALFSDNEAPKTDQQNPVAITVTTGTDLSDSGPDTGTNARRQELQYLKEVLPENLMIPTEKTAAEVDALLADFETNKQLQELIETDKASPEDRQNYYALRMRKYDEEIALIQLCNDVAGNSLADADERQAQLCTHVAASSTERLQVINDSIEQLEQQVLFSGRSE